jgi:hypothetical protein
MMTTAIFAMQKGARRNKSLTPSSKLYGVMVQFDCRRRAKPADTTTSLAERNIYEEQQIDRSDGGVWRWANVRLGRLG